MGRGKVQLRRIEDKNSRMVTFSKRRTGLMKKASELAILCDVELALVVFSERGKVYEFSSGDSLRKVLDHYQSHLNAEQAVCKRAYGAKKHQGETAQPLPGSDLVQTVQRYLDGIKIEQMDGRELTQLEEQLDSILTKTRSRKEELNRQNHLMESEIAAIVGEESGDRRLVSLDPDSSAAAAAAAAFEDDGFCMTAAPFYV